ncbi:radical SAM protein [Pelomyxa schiedti]|nr:radical SAM protein [Pelomyxa schiedti]
MSKVTSTTRSSKVLTPSKLECLSHCATINPSAGCAHRCIYCYAAGFFNTPREPGAVKVYSNLAEKVAQELRGGVNLPPRVYFSPSCDGFQPVTEVQDITFKIIKEILTHGKEVAFLTKGLIRDDTLKLLVAHPTKVFAQIGLVSLDAAVASVVEPGAAPPQDRLAQMRALVASNISTSVRLDPILPGVSDSPEALNSLFESIASAGVKRAACSYLFLRPKIKSMMQSNPSPIVKTILGHYSSSGATTTLTLRGSQSKICCLSHEYRESHYELIKQIAQSHGVEVTICACKNYDIEGSSSCGIAGPTPATSKTTSCKKTCAARQTTLKLAKPKPSSESDSESDISSESDDSGSDSDSKSEEDESSSSSEEEKPLPRHRKASSPAVVPKSKPSTKKPRTEPEIEDLVKTPTKPKSTSTTTSASTTTTRTSAKSAQTVVSKKS